MFAARQARNLPKEMLIQSGDSPVDPWGADTNRSSNSAFQPQSYTSYTRDLNGDQDAMARRYSVSGRFSQPDPYSGSYDFSDPQSLNRYAYVGNDPVNRKDPSGLAASCTTPDGMDGWVGDDGKCYATVVNDTRSPILVSPLSQSSIVSAISSRGYLAGTRDHGADPGGPNPQKTLQDIINEKAQTAASQKLIDNEDCRKFIQRLINETQGGPIMGLPGAPASAWVGLTAYSEAAIAGRITASGKSGKSGDTTTWGSTTGFSKISWNKEFYDLSVSDAALQILHESLHLINGFTDQALARAASIIRDPKHPQSFALDAKGTNAASQYLNDRIKDPCQ